MFEHIFFVWHSKFWFFCQSGRSKKHRFMNFGLSCPWSIHQDQRFWRNMFQWIVTCCKQWLSLWHWKTWLSSFQIRSFFVFCWGTCWSLEFLPGFFGPRFLNHRFRSPWRWFFGFGNWLSVGSGICGRWFICLARIFALCNLSRILASNLLLYLLILGYWYRKKSCKVLHTYGNRDKSFLIFFSFRDLSIINYVNTLLVILRRYYCFFESWFTWAEKMGFYWISYRLIRLYRWYWLF